MGRFARLCRLPTVDVLRLVEAGAATLAAEIGLRLLPPKTCLALARRSASTARPSAPVDTARLARLVEIADGHLPGRSTCLRRALALSWVLGRRGVRTTVNIGVARQGGDLLAHAWLETDSGQRFGATDEPTYSRLPLSRGASPPARTSR